MEERNALAMVFVKTEQPFVAKQIRWPELKEGEVLVALKYATICSSDLHTYYGRRKGHQPSILGHETLGEIVAIATAGVQDYYGDALKIGDTVTWSVYAHDHGGEMARKGIPQKSRELFKYGHEKLEDDHLLSGGFASHCHLKQGTDIFKLPADLPIKVAAPINCTHATVAGALRMAGDLKGKNVLVIGAGMLGLSACAMSKEAGARHVWTMDIIEDRLKKSLEFGVDATIDARLPEEEIAALLRGINGVDILVETSGVPSAMEKGIDLLNIGGISVWVGAVYSQGTLNLNAEKVVRNILTIKGLHNYTPEDLATAVKFVEKNWHRYPFEKLVTSEFSLQELNQAFLAASGRGHYRIGVHFR